MSQTTAFRLFSPSGAELDASGFLRLAEATMQALPAPTVLHDFSEILLEKLHAYRGGEGELADDLTLMTLRREPLSRFEGAVISGALWTGFRPRGGAAGRSSLARK